MSGRKVAHFAGEWLFTSVFNSNVGHEKVLFTCGIFTFFTFERFVVGMGQLVIEKMLFVSAGVVAELTLKHAVAAVLYVREEMHFEGVAFLERFPTLVAHVRFFCAVRLHVLRETFLHRVNTMTDGAWKLRHFGNHVHLSTLFFVVDS